MRMSAPTRHARLVTPHNTPPHARPPTLVSTALRANYRRGRWFESTAAHHESDLKETT